MKKVSKKTLSFFLAIVMVITMLPAFALSATADNDDYYLFAYFTGNAVNEQRLNFALSEDGLNFKALNGNRPVVIPQKTSANNSSGCARDPYIARAQDGSFYMVATDMDASESWSGDTCIYVWHSENLVDWTQITDLDVSAAGAFVDGNGTPLAGTATLQFLDDVNDSTSYLRTNDFGSTIRAWAPQFIWDENEQAYMVYWSNFFDTWRCAVVYSYTTDFITFTEPQYLYAAPNKADGNWQAAIDEDIHYNSADNTWYMYYKDEESGTICYVTSDNLTGPYTATPTKVISTDIALEGANCHLIGDTLTMFADAYVDGYFVALQSTDYKNFTQLDDSAVSINQLNPRHASVVQITKAEYDRMAEAYGLSTETDVTYNFTYPYSNNNWKWEYYKDSSGYECVMRPGDGSVTVAKNSGYVSLDRSYLFINHDEPTAVNMLPDDIYTISFDVIMDNAAYSGAPIITLSTGDNGGGVQDFFMLFGNGQVWLQESGASNDHYVGETEIKEGVEYTFTLVSDGTTISLYKDGELVCSENATIDFPSSGTRYVGFGWSDDHPWTLGCYSYKNIRFRDYSLTASQVKSEYAEAKLIYQSDDGTYTFADRYNVTRLYNSRKQLATYTGDEKAQAYTISMWVNPGDTIDSDAALVEIADGFTNNVEDNSKKYFSILEDGRIYYCYGDGNNVHFIDLNYDGAKFALTASTWQLLTIVIYPYASYNALKVYVDDTLQYTSTGAGNNLEGSDYTMSHFFRQPRNVYAGQGNAYWTAYANSYIDDLRIYAGAMDPSVLLTELQNEYAITVAREYVENNISNFNSAYINFAASAYHEGNATTGAGSNVVYCSTNTGWNMTASSTEKNYAKIKHLKLKLPMPMNIVLVYDGTHKASLPIELESIAYKTGNTSYNPNMKTLYSTNTSFHLDHYWYGFLNGDYQSWAGATINASNAAQKIGYGNGTDYDYDSGEQDNTSTQRFWWNELDYVGTGDTTNYYEVFNASSGTQIGFNLYSKDKSTDYSNEALYNNESSTYVLNYQPIYSIIDEARQYYYDVVQGNEWKYTEESLNNYYLAIYEVMKCNPNNYTYSDNVAGAVQTCAADIKNAVQLYNAINLEKIRYTVTYNLTNSVQSEIVEAGDYLANIPANTATASDYDSESHTIYSWPSTVSSTYMPLDNVTFNEISQTSACTDANNDTICDVCHQQLKLRANWDAFNAAKTQLEAALAASNSTVKHSAAALESVADAIDAITFFNSTDAEKHDILATEQTTVDNQVQMITNALSALQNDVVENDDVYAELSKNIATLNADAMDVETVQAAVNSVPVTSTVEVNGNDYSAYSYDAYITEYLTQMNTEENYIPYTVTVKTASNSTLYVVDNGDGTFSYTSAKASASNFHYGDEITLANPNVDASSDYACSWAVSAKPQSAVNASASRHVTYANTFTFNVRGAMTITTGNSRTDNSYRIVFKESLNGANTDKILDVQYVDAGSAFSFAKAVLPNVAFYSKGASPYSVSYDDGTTKTQLSGASFTPTGDCIVYVNYTSSNSSDYLIEFYNTDDDYDYVEVKFNEAVTFTDDNAVAFVTYVDDDTDGEIKSVLCYGTSYTFYACQDMVIFAVDSIDEIASVGVCSAPIIDNINNKTYLVGSFALPADCTVQSYGFVMNGGDPEPEQLSLADLDQDNFIVNLTSSNCTNVGQRGNQFSVKFNNIDTAWYMPSYVAYVIYTDGDGNTQYAYSEIIKNAAFD